jgi:parallel beta-helix repeat protein
MQNTDNGIELITFAAYNYINFNNISFNANGINITGSGSSSDINSIYSNIISYNSKHGIFIDDGSGNNIFHNLILFNNNQAKDVKTNNWDSNNEGNYWSDYIGVDNGSGGRYAGDGIGDTHIPHPEVGYDNYPFTNAWGWLIAPEPELFDPGQLNTNGSYTVSWNQTPRAMGYILEEDTEWIFNSPNEIYNGTELSFDIEGRDNATYYYRLKTFITNDESDWSEKVEIIVDWYPSSPTGLNASNPKGHSVTLTWNANPEPDIQQYYIFINSTESNSSFTYLTTVLGTDKQYIITGLVEETTYYFAISAVDKYSHSTMSIVVSITTLDETAPALPTGLNATAVSNTEILLSWNTSTEPDIAGYHIYINSTGGPSAVFKYNHTVSNDVQEVLISGLIEQVTYYFKIVAFDEVPNNSIFSNMVSATTPDLIPPHKPTGLNVSDSTESSLILTWNANSDHDVIGYFIYGNQSVDGNFHNLTSVPVTDTEFIDLGLEENTTYYYKIKAVDDIGLVSEFSEIISGKTKIKTPGPEVKEPVDEIEIYEDTVDMSLHITDIFPNIEVDIEENDTIADERFITVIILTNGTIQLEPSDDWSGVTTIKFFGWKQFGMLMKIKIQQNLTVTVLPVNDPPEQIQILIFNYSKKITEGDIISFEGSCSDPDLDYGDALTFKWISSKDGDLGFGEKLSDIKLSTGKHIITLLVTDNEGASASISINLTVNQKSEPESDSIDNYVIIISLVIIIVIIIVVAIFFILRRKKKSPEAVEPSVEESPIPPQSQAQQIQEPEPEQQSYQGYQEPPQTTPTPEQLEQASPQIAPEQSVPEPKPIPEPPTEQVIPNTPEQESTTQPQQIPQQEPQPTPTIQEPTENTYLQEPVPSQESESESPENTENNSEEN